MSLESAGATGTIGGALFIQGGTLSGTGVFPAFVQISGSGGPNDPKEAYNTTVNKVLNNGSSDTFNHEIRVSDLGIQVVSNVTYYQFLLDINENNNDADRFLSLDKITVLTSTTPNQSVQGLPTGTVRYSLDAIEDSEILLDYSLNPGSGKFDMTMLIPVSAFGGASGTDYVYLYSLFGAYGEISTGSKKDKNLVVKDYRTSDGFEEWALNNISVPPPPCEGDECTVPEPASLLLLGAGLAAVVVRLRRKSA